MNEFWNRIFLDNTLKQWAIALGIIVGSILLLRLIEAVVISRLRKFSERSKTTLDDFLVKMIHKSVMPLLYCLTAYFGLKSLSFPDRVDSILHVAVMVVVAFFVLRMITSFISYVFQKAFLRNEDNQQRIKQSKGILLIVQIGVWLLGVIFLIDNLGYDITTLVAGLGIGGIAIALAAQTVLADLFSYLVIFFDKPFEIGDFIMLGDKVGTIEYVGIKTTRIRTLSGEQLICSNTDLTNSRVHNFKRMRERRILFSIGVVYATPAEKLERIPAIIKQVIDEADGVRFDRAHFLAFGDFSLNFEIVYYVLTPDYNEYMNKQQQINMALFRTFEEEGIEFAFPTQNILLSRVKQEEMN